MVGYNPENNEISLDPKECEWALFGFASGEFDSPFSYAILEAVEKFEKKQKQGILWEDERLVGEGKRITVSADNGMAEALFGAMAVWRYKNTQPQMLLLENAEETPLKKLVVTEDELVAGSMGRLREISRSLRS